MKKIFRWANEQTENRILLSHKKYIKCKHFRLFGLIYSESIALHIFDMICNMIWINKPSAMLWYARYKYVNQSW